MDRPFLIAPQKTGLETDIDPFLLPEDAYPELENMYVYRGRLKRRLGYGTLGRLEHAFTASSLGNSGASPWSFNIFTLTTTGASDPNKTIKEGSVVITISSGPIVFIDQGDGTLTSPTAGNSGIINYSTGDVTLTHTAGAGVATAIDFSYYPNRIVMGLTNYELTAINRERLLAFDTRYSYLYSTANNRFEVIPNSATPTTWTTTDIQFFWSYNAFQSGANTLLWATNNNATDGIRYYNGSVWTNYVPRLASGGTPTLQTALIILAYKERLIALNTQEAGVRYPNRVRFSQIGDVLATGAWDSDIPGKGGFIDAPTSEQIVTAFFYSDTLIVGFERSLWQLRATGNFILPFTWQRVSPELGAESTFSNVAFDDGVLMVGNRAIIKATSNAAQRIDERIPDTVFEFHNDNDGPKRVHGARDFRQELVYWTFPTAQSNNKFPNRTLVYNYRDATWAIFKDAFTCFGNYQAFDDRTWADLNFTWANAAIRWNDPSLQSAFPSVCAGNTQGFVFRLNDGTIGNSSSRYISDITTADPAVVTSVEHGFDGGEWIKITGVVGMTEITTQEIFQVGRIDNDTFRLFFLNNGIIEDFGTTSTYAGGGLIEELPNFSVRTKRFSPFMSLGRGVSISRADYFVTATSSGQFNLEVIPNERQNDSINYTVDTSLQTTAIPPSSRGFQNKYWTRVFINSSGQLLQFNYFLTDEQMQDLTNVYSDVVIHAVILHAKPSMRIIG